MRVFVTASLAVLLSACGSSGADTSRAAFEDWLRDTGTSAEDVPCVADEVYGSLAEDDLRTILNLDADSGEHEWLVAADVAEAEFECVGNRISAG